MIKHNKISSDLSKYIDAEEVFEPLEMAFDTLLETVYNDKALDFYYEKINSGYIEDMQSLYNFMEENKHESI